MGIHMKLVKDYMPDAAMRQKLNELTREVFGFDFESWVAGGYFEGDYIPWSYEEDGRLVANVSVNRMDFWQEGQLRHYIQLGTVMTRADCRGRGLARELMAQVIREYQDKCDGIYLFGNLNALGFYDKLGFSRGMQFRYSLRTPLPRSGEAFALAGAGRRAHYQQTVREAAFQSAFSQRNGYALQMFYTAGMDRVFYSAELDCYAVLEQEGDTLFLQAVTAGHQIPLAQVISRLPGEWNRLILGFTPRAEDAALFECAPFDGGEDYRLFYLGEALADIEKRKLYFPQLSHA